jgi:hypothetical protein
MTDREFIAKIKELVPGISQEAVGAIYGLVAEEKCRAFREGYDVSIVKEGTDAASLRRELAQVRAEHDELLNEVRLSKLD